MMIQCSAPLSSEPEIPMDFDTQQGITLENIIVSARESNGLTSSSRIDRAAMQHLQPTSFTDLLELLPGNMSQTPDMASANTISLRETGTLSATGVRTDNPDYAISSLGTMFLIDGAPISTESNMQGIPQAVPGSDEYKRDLTNKGVDMRTISTDNIESVEIIRGIPSAEYGNLTSGLVNIKRISRSIPLTARFKADEYSKLFSIAKGFELNENLMLNFDGGYLDSKADPRDNLENYKRINLSTRVKFNFRSPHIETSWSIGADYTGSFDNAKTDPDLNYNKIDEYRSSYNRCAITSNLLIEFESPKWIRALRMNASASYQVDRLQRRRQVAPQRASVAPTSMEEGIHDGKYLLSEYIADFISDGRPLNLFLKASANGLINSALFSHEYKTGIDWTMTKNLGKGQIYDLSHPLSASWSTRPRDFITVPALHTFSFFAEDKITWTPHGNFAELQAGVRGLSLLHLPTGYNLRGKLYLDPRINAVWNFPFLNVGNKKTRFLLAAGFGLTTKMPTADYLFPQAVYSDMIQLNYYDVENPTEHSRINLRTYINDPVNKSLKAARNRKWEIRFGVEWGESRLSVTYFEEQLNSGFRYSTLYKPFEYRKYDESAITGTLLTAPPDLTNIPYTDLQVLDGYRMVTNGTRLEKRGIEFQASTPRWKPLATSLTVTGAWFRSVYANSSMMFSTVNDVVGNIAVSDKYVGVYNTDEGRINNRFNTNFMFDTRIPRWGLMLTTSLQCLWFVTTRRMPSKGMPDYYIAAEDGALHPFTAESAEDPLLRYLVKKYNDDAFKTQSVPPAIYLNLKVTKKIGKGLRISAFVNNIIDYLPNYYSNGLLVRRVSEAYFGVEINLTI